MLAINHQVLWFVFFNKHFLSVTFITIKVVNIVTIQTNVSIGENATVTLLLISGKISEFIPRNSKIASHFNWLL